MWHVATAFSIHPSEVHLLFPLEPTVTLTALSATKSTKMEADGAGPSKEVPAFLAGAATGAGGAAGGAGPSKPPKPPRGGGGGRGKGGGGGGKGRGGGGGAKGKGAAEDKGKEPEDTEAIAAGQKDNVTIKRKRGMFTRERELLVRKTPKVHCP